SPAWLPHQHSPQHSPPKFRLPAQFCVNAVHRAAVSPLATPQVPHPPGNSQERARSSLQVSPVGSHSETSPQIGSNHTGRQSLVFPVDTHPSPYHLQSRLAIVMTRMSVTQTLSACAGLPTRNSGSLFPGSHCPLD